MPAALDRILDALAEPGQPGPPLRALEAVARETVGAKLFTVMAYDPMTAMAHRLHTSDPAAYPVSGAKPLPAGPWSTTVIDGKRPFVANTIEAIAEVFPDHALIDSLGCQSVVNAPVIFDGQVIGTVNLLHEAGFYTPGRVDAAMALRPCATLALLAALAAGTMNPAGRTDP